MRPNQTIAVDAGNTITFVCVAYGIPSPSISWTSGDTALNNDSRVTIYEEVVTEDGVIFVNSILELCSTEEADAGQYSCFADNTLGNDTASFVLTVNAQSKKMLSRGSNLNIDINYCHLQCHERANFKDVLSGRLSVYSTTLLLCRYV